MQKGQRELPFFVCARFVNKTARPAFPRPAGYLSVRLSASVLVTRTASPVYNAACLNLRRLPRCANNSRLPSAQPHTNTA
jgi:hypothetical protein